MWCTILIYGLILAAGSFGLEWLRYRFLIRTHPVEAYVVLVALAFMGFGIWVGARLFSRSGQPAAELNTRAQTALGISPRELEVLELLAAGRSNKEIAVRLDVSPNTVKTHVAKLFNKLPLPKLSRSRDVRQPALPAADDLHRDIPGGRPHLADLGSAAA